MLKNVEFFSAALTDSFFSSGMCLGRMFSVLLSTIFLPSTLLCSSTLFCGVASLLLLLLAPHFKEGLYSGVLIMGFFVSWQFGTGFSWTSQYMNITGKLSSLFFVGKYTDKYLWRLLTKLYCRTLVSEIYRYGGMLQGVPKNYAMLLNRLLG